LLTLCFVDTSGGGGGEHTAEASESATVGFVETPKGMHGSSGGLPLQNDARVNNQENNRHSGASYKAGTPPQQMQQAPPARSQPSPHIADQGQGEASFQGAAQPQSGENNDKSRQFPSLMQLSEQQLYKYRERMMGAPNLVAPYHRVSLSNLLRCVFFSNFLLGIFSIIKKAASPMDRLGIMEAVEDSKNDETFEDAAPVTPGTLADLSSATLELVEAQGTTTNNTYDSIVLT